MYLDNLAVPLTGAPSAPQLSGAGSASPAAGIGSTLAGNKSGVGGLLAGFLGGGAAGGPGMGFSASDSSKITPTQTTAQVGADNEISLGGGGGFLTKLGVGGSSPWAVIALVLVFGVILWAIAKD